MGVVPFDGCVTIMQNINFYGRALYENGRDQKWASHTYYSAESAMNVPYMKYLPIKTRTGDKSARKRFSDVCFAIKTLKFLLPNAFLGLAIVT